MVDLHRAFQEEIIAPQHAFIHAQAFALVVDAMLEQAFPAWSLVGKEFRRAEGLENEPGILVVSLSFLEIVTLFCQS
jgi:hypothetical protein